jgi:Leucine-rich repeat (LRR) protein
LPDGKIKRKEYKEEMTDVKREDGKSEEFDEEIVEDDDEYYDEEEVVDGDEEEVVEGDEEEVVEGDEEVVVEGDDDEIFEEEVVDSNDESEGAVDDSIAPSSSDVALDSAQSALLQQEGFTDFSTVTQTHDEETGMFVSNGPAHVVEQPQRTVPPKFAVPPVNRGPVVDDMDPKSTHLNPCCYWLVCLFICGLLGAGGYVGWFLVNEDQSDGPNLREGGNITRAPTQAPTTALTTVFDPVQGNCKLKALSNPHPIDQCRCFAEIRKVADDVLHRYEFLVETFIPTIYLEYAEGSDYCSARNQALMWLASGNDFSFTEEERTERFALATFYVELFGSNWTSQEKWLSEASICKWEGVTCDDEGRLQILELSDNKLFGSGVSTKDGKHLSTESANNNVEASQFADLSFALSQVPPEIALLKYMQQFLAAKNQIGGAFPEGLFSISNLQLIDLNTNSLTGPIPPSIQYATQLKELNVGENLMSGRITQLLGSATNLEVLYLGSNGFVGSLPLEFFNLVNLTHLDIGGNAFTGSIPSEIASFSNLTELSLGPNDFAGELPTSFVELVSLTSLVIQDIPTLEGRLPAIYGQELKSLTELIITETGIEGDIEPVFGELPFLRRLDLSKNKLRGTIPTELGNLYSLTFMDLGSNFLGGSIPSALGNLGNLTRMILSDNLLSGEIPDSFSSLLDLEFLRLDGNGLTGRVADEVCALRAESLASLMVDCPFTENGVEVGVICEIPSCCTACRTAGGR